MIRAKLLRPPNDDLKIVKHFDGLSQNFPTIEVMEMAPRHSG